MANTQFLSVRLNSILLLFSKKRYLMIKTEFVIYEERVKLCMTMVQVEMGSAGEVVEQSYLVKLPLVLQ